MSSSVESLELPSVYIADALLENCFDAFALDNEKLGTYLAGQKFPEGAIEETTVSFFSGEPPNANQDAGGTLVAGDAVVVFAENIATHFVTEIFNTGKPVEPQRVNTTVSKVIDKVIKHEFSHRKDEVDPRLKQEVDAYEQCTHALVKTTAKKTAIRFAFHELVLLDALELLAKTDVISAGAVPGTLALGGLGVVFGLRNSLRSARNDICAQRYEAAPHEERAYEAQGWGMTGFVDIAIKPEFIDGVIEKLQPRRRYW